MYSVKLRQIEAQWQANPNDPKLARAALAAFREQRVDAPFELLLTSDDWLPFVEVANTWSRAPLTPDCGYSTQELDKIENRGIRFPPTLREWWRIAGRHPCCGKWADTWYGYFIKPEEAHLWHGNL